MKSKDILTIYIKSNHEIYTEIIQAIMNIQNELIYEFNKNSPDDLIKLQNYLIITCKLPKSEVLEILK